MAHAVGITVGAGTTVLEVALVGIGDATWYAHAGATVGNSPAELVDRRGLQTADQTTLVVLSSAGIVGLDMLGVLFGELLDGSLDSGDTVLLSHLVGGEVAVTSGTVPGSFHGLRVERHDDTVVFGDTPQQVPGNPDIIGTLHS